MSRSAIDATRFTATSPHAYSKPFAIRSSSAPASSAISSSSHPLPPSFLSPLYKKNALPSQKASSNPTTPPIQKSPETPAQKVARLRAARFAAKYAEAPLWDRIVIRGRYVADKAHRITVYSLMGLTVVSAVVATYALTDMVIYNRRKRKAYYAEQAASRTATLLAAIENEKAGMELTADQTLVLNQERIRFREEERKRERWNWKGWLVKGLKAEDIPGPIALKENGGGGGVLQAVEAKAEHGVWEAATSEEQALNDENVLAARAPAPAASASQTSSPAMAAESSAPNSSDPDKSTPEELDALVQRGIKKAKPKWWWGL